MHDLFALIHDGTGPQPQQSPAKDNTVACRHCAGFWPVKELWQRFSSFAPQPQPSRENIHIIHSIVRTKGFVGFVSIERKQQRRIWTSWSKELSSTQQGVPVGASKQLPSLAYYSRWAKLNKIQTLQSTSWGPPKSQSFSVSATKFASLGVWFLS